MSIAQNLSYAVVQVAHNFGAAAVVGGSLAGVIIRNPQTRRRLAWLTLGGWGTQAVSGAAFGAVSFYFYHRFPDISGIAVNALVIKMSCVAIGIALISAYIIRGNNWRNETRSWIWLASASLAIAALSSAAFLRWFS